MNVFYLSLLWSEIAVLESGIASWLLNFYGRVINYRFSVLFYFFLSDILISTKSHAPHAAFLPRSLMAYKTQWLIDMGQTSVRQWLFETLLITWNLAGSSVTPWIHSSSIKLWQQRPFRRMESIIVSSTRNSLLEGAGKLFKSVIRAIIS